MLIIICFVAVSQEETNDQESLSSTSVVVSENGLKEHETKHDPMRGIKPPEDPHDGEATEGHKNQYEEPDSGVVAQEPLEENEEDTSMPPLSSDYMQATQRNSDEDDSEMVLGNEAARKVEKELTEMKRKVRSLESELGDQVHEKRKCLEQAEQKYVMEKSALQKELVDVKRKLKDTIRELEKKTAELREKEHKMNEDTARYEDDKAKREAEKAEYEQKITNLEKKNRETEGKYDEVVAQREKGSHSLKRQNGKTKNRNQKSKD